MRLRVVIVTRIPPVLAAFDAVVRGTGHEPVAFLTMRNVDGRYGPPADTGDLVLAAADELDVLLPAHRRTIAPLLASVEPEPDHWEFTCECGAPDCREAVSLTLAEYEAQRAAGQPVVAPGHGRHA